MGNSDYLSHFQSKHYQSHNLARLSHLESLQFDFWGKKILEIGAGIGDHTYYYLLKNCNILPTDARPELIEYIMGRFELEGKVIDADNDWDDIKSFTKFDYIHCYGLLYHLKYPQKFLEAIRDTGKTLLLETCVSPDQSLIDIHNIPEDKDNPTQAKTGIGCRPSRKWIEAELKKYYPYIYFPKTQPKHEEFPLDWRNTSNTGLIRCIFVASHEKIDNRKLTTTMPVFYEAME